MYQTSHALTHLGTVREINEDAFLELTKYGIWVVADGMGGHAAGDVASQLVIDSLQVLVTNTPKDSLNCQLIIDCLKDANRKLLSLSDSTYRGKSLGTTVVILFVKDETAYFLWAGDSRAYLLRDQQLSQITKDHSQVNDMVDEGVLSLQQAEQHPLANVITRAIGVFDDLEVSVIQLTLQNEDLFLLCSDGLNKELSDLEIQKTLQSASIIDSGMALIHTSLVRNARDNVTCIVIKNRQKEVVVTQSDDFTIPLFK